MPKRIVQDATRQIKQVPGEILERAKEQTGEMPDVVLEQLGVGSAQSQLAPKRPVADSHQTGLTELKAKDEAETRKRIAQLTSELKAGMQKWRQTREEKERQRQTTEEELKKQKEAVEEQEESLVEPTTRRKRGLFGSSGRRVKTAQQKAQAETVVRRTSG